MQRPLAARIAGAVFVFALCLLLSGIAPLAAQALAEEPQTGESVDRIARALELHKGGRSRADDVIAELDLELRDHPDNTRALMMKAMVQAGVERFDEALATLDRHDQIMHAAGQMNPKAVLIRARTLFFKGDLAEAKRILQAGWAFFQGDAHSEAVSTELLEAIEAAQPEASSKITKP